MKKFLPAVLLVPTMATAALAQVPAPPQPQPPVLVVTGNGEVTATPDEAFVRLGIVRQAAVAQAANTGELAVCHRHASISWRPMCSV